MAGKTADATQRANLQWLGDNLRFTLLLDEVGRKMKPCYRLKDRWLQGELDGDKLKDEAQAASKQLASAPVEELFRTFSRRVRSQGELGELSSLNQKLWRQYRKLETFLAGAGAKKGQE